MQNVRKYELDILRIWGCILVIISHLACLVIYDTSYAQWRVANYIYVARNCCVPLFFMLSGILLLKREYIPYKRLVMNSLKFLSFYIVGTTVFYIIRNGQDCSIRSIVTSIVPGVQNPSHFWYLAELVGVYLFVPILRKIVTERRLCEYYLVLWVLYFILLPNVEVWFEITNNSFLSSVANVLSSFHAKEFYTYAGYLVLGYYLFYINDRYIKWYVWSIMLIGSILFPALINEYYVSITQTSIPTIWEYNSFSALIQTSCYVIIAKQYLSRIKCREFVSKSLSKISEATFGIYLIHPIFTEAFFKTMISNKLLFTIPVLALVTFCISAAIVLIARYVKKKAVAIWSTFTQLKKKYLVFTIVLWGRAFLLVRFNCGMYADGSWSFVKLLASGRLVNAEEAFFEARKGAMGMIRIFEYALLRLGITEFNILSFSYSLGCVFWTTLFLSLSLYICYNYKNERILDHSIILWSLILTFVGLYSTHESLLAISILWFVFVCVCNWEQLSNSPMWVGFLTLTLFLCLTGIYESFAIVGFSIILFFMVKKLKNKKNIYLRHSNIIVFLILLNSVKALLDLRKVDNSAAMTGFISSFFEQSWELVVLLVLLALLLLYKEIFYKRDSRRLKILEFALAAMFCIYMIWDPNRIAYECRALRSLFSLALPVAFIAFELLLLYFQAEKRSASNVLPFVLAIACIISVYNVGMGYYGYLKTLYSLTDNNTGFIAWDTTSKFDDYNTDWTVPYESLIASKMFSQENIIDSIVVQQKEDIYFQQHDMWNIDSYYDLTKYRVVYNKSAFALSKHIPNALGSLLNISFNGDYWNANTVVEYGISTNEGAFTWTEGEYVQFYPILIDSYSSDSPYSYMLTLDVALSYHIPQQMIVYCGDREVYRTTVPLMGGIFEIPVYPDAEGIIELGFAFPDAVSPDMVEHTGDTRVLGVGLVDAELKAYE